LSVFDDRLTLHEGENSWGRTITVPIEALRDLRIEGQSITKGGGFVGGGFGVTGAAEGMLIATVINKLTTKTTKLVTIALIADNGWVELRLEGKDALVVRQALRTVLDAVFAYQNALAGTPSQSQDEEKRGDLVSELERLARLRDDGALTDKEFASAKARLLDDVPSES
jgi:hypothetical protein